MTTLADDAPVIHWGRCRTGRRWFWTAVEIGTGTRLEGKADTKEEAARQGHLAALQLADGEYAHITVAHGAATSRLRALNAAKCKARPTPKVTDPGPVEYLYYLYDGDRDGNGGQAEVWKYRITKKTRTRIYFTPTLNPRDPSPPIGFVDRDQADTYREVWHHGQHLYLDPPNLPQQRSRPDLKALKQAMADSHPDRGGTDEAFIEARQRYLRARRARAQP